MVALGLGNRSIRTFVGLIGNFGDPDWPGILAHGNRGRALPLTPEQLAREKIEAALAASGWLVQNRDDLDLTAGPGIAVREFPMKSGFGFADYPHLAVERSTK